MTSAKPTVVMFKVSKQKITDFFCEVRNKFEVKS